MAESTGMGARLAAAVATRVWQHGPCGGGAASYGCRQGLYGSDRDLNLLLLLLLLALDVLLAEGSVTTAARRL